MSGRLEVRLATRADNDGISGLLRETPSPGPVSIALAHEPSFFDAIEVTGHERRVIVGELDGRIVGVGVMALRQVFLNGRPATVGYLGALRVAAEARRFGALARGYRFFGQLHRSERRVPFYLSTIMEENVEARRLLASRRAGLPTYHELGRYRALVFPLLRPPSPEVGHLRVVGGTEAGPDAVLSLLDDVGRQRQFFPVLTADDLTSSTGALRGLSLADFLVALDGTRPAGTLAVWDQSGFRQTLVAGYRGALRQARGLLGSVARRLLPEPGTPLPGVVVACMAVPPDRPDVLRALLRRGRQAALRRGRTFLSVGMAADDPLQPATRRHFRFTLESRVYAVEWGDGREDVRRLDGRPLHLELGSL